MLQSIKTKAEADAIVERCEEWLAKYKGWDADYWHYSLKVHRLVNLVHIGQTEADYDDEADEVGYVISVGFMDDESPYICLSFDDFKADVMEHFPSDDEDE